MKNIVIFISGRGSNMQAVVQADIPGTRVAAVLSDNPDAAGLQWAAAQGIPTFARRARDFASRADFHRAMLEAAEQYRPDLVLLAGYLKILPGEFCAHYQGRLINIHPSLLPAFPGLHTHQRAIDEGCRLAGCTVHFVTAELDCGPIIAQGAVPVYDTDTADTLAARVLKIEHQLLPQAVADFAAGNLSIHGKRVHNRRTAGEAGQNGAYGK